MLANSSHGAAILERACEQLSAYRSNHKEGEENRLRNCGSRRTSSTQVQVNGRIIKKRIHVRVEHVRPSRCREEFLQRRTKNEELKKDAKAKGGECFLMNSAICTICLLHYLLLYTPLSGLPVLLCCSMLRIEPTI
jgi:hypothetical protein